MIALLGFHLKAFPFRVICVSSLGLEDYPVLELLKYRFSHLTTRHLIEVIRCNIVQFRVTKKATGLLKLITLAPQ